LLADKAFDAQKRVIEPLLAADITPVIPSVPGRKNPRPYDRDLYEERHLIENFFCRLKQFRAIATLYDKRASNFLAGVYAVATLFFAQMRTLPNAIAIADLLMQSCPSSDFRAVCFSQAGWKSDEGRDQTHELAAFKPQGHGH